ncbi:MAG: pyridoxal kinase PdxY [Treponema sp.]|nr:pyridoxal kinase PdxY [Treponema sp.]
MAVLSIQSHVVYGYAGNTAAVFPLQRLGREVWAVNTVEFSNHTGYGSWKGQVLGAQLVSDLVTGLEERGVLNRCDAVLSGYLGDASICEAIIETVKKVRNAKSDVLYCCDPVMGDVGRGFFVKPDIPDMIKSKLIPLADIICPNQFEMETISGVEIKTIEDAVKALKTVHEMGPSVILVTSFREEPGKLSMLVSDKTNVYKTTTAELALCGNAAGTGDMTTAVFLSHYLETKNAEKALELCTASVYGVLESSYKGSINNSNNPIELNIIDEQHQFIFPSHSFKAEKILL